MTPEEYFRTWSKDCRLFINYKPIHDHQDMMRFAKDYHTNQLTQPETVECKGCEESTGETKLFCCNHCGNRTESFTSTT